MKNDQKEKQTVIETQQKQPEVFFRDYNLVYRVNLNDASYSLLKIDEGIIGAGMEFDDFTDARSFFIEEVAYESDRALLRYEMDFERIRDRLLTESSYKVEYRAVVDGVAIWHEMEISALAEDEVIIGFGIRDAEVLNRHISKALMDNYDAIYVVNLNTDQMKVLKASGIMNNKPEIVVYSKMLKEFAEGLSDEAKKYFESLADLEYEKRILKAEGKTEYSYESPYYGKEPKWVKCELHVLTWSDGEPETAVIGISGIDSVQRERIILRDRLEEALREVTEERNRFSVAADLINSANWSFTLDDNDEIIDADFYGEPSKVLGIDLKISPHGWEEILHPDDKEAALKAFNAAIKDHSGKTPYDVIYRMMDRFGNYNWFRSAGKVIINSEGKREFFGIHINVNDEIEEQKKRIEDVEQSRKLVEGVASIYRFAFTVNMARNEFRLIRMDDEVKARLHVSSIGSYGEAVAALFEMLHDSDKKKMEYELGFDTIKKKIAKANSYNVEYRVITGGATCWHEVNVTKISDDEVAMGFGERDLEITKRHLEEIRFAEYFALYEVDIYNETVKVVIDSPFYKTGKPGTVLPYGSAMRAFADTFEGETRDFFNQLADLDFVKRELTRNERQSYTYRASDKTGGRWADCTSYVTARDEDGNPAMFTLGFSFVDAYGAARQELQEQIAQQKTQLEEQQLQLQKSFLKAQEANMAKTEFLFNMSHDVRTPMNAILGYTNMAEKHLDDNEKVADCLEKIKQSGNLLLELINGVLDMSRIESGEMSVEEREGDVYLCFNEIESTLLEEAAANDVELSFEMGEISDRYVYADFTRCMRVFTNLISNSIKYTRAGGYVKVRCEQAGVGRDGVADYRFIFEDNGIGMSEEFQEHMYEPFTREYNSTASGIQGTGLGLSVCKSFVDYLGGTIECESSPGEGTKFTVTLPFKLQKEQYYTDPVTGEVKNGDTGDIKKRISDLKGKRGLLVEDNDMNREIAMEILEEEGLIIDEANDGSVAVKLLEEKGPDYYDFILMDIQMPIMNGYEATRIIRQLYPQVRIPILALSANAFEEDREASKAAGMDDHIAKPIKLAELFAALVKYVL